MDANGVWFVQYKGGGGRFQRKTFDGGQGVKLAPSVLNG